MIQRFALPLVAWVRDRLGLEPILDFLARHKVPASLGGRAGWMYVFGMCILASFAVQLATGVALATVYVPSATLAHESIRYITEDIAFGAILRGLHYYGASAMVLLVLVHMLQVYLAGAYKYPREMNWISGVVLLVLVMAMALTGQMLRWDEDGLWTVVVAAKFVARVPLIGAYLADIVLGGPTVGGATLTRFYALHVFVLPGLIIGLVGLHLYLALHHGVSEPPKAGQPVDPATYKAKYAALKARGIPYVPDVAWKEVAAAVAVIVVIVSLTLVLGPKPMGAPPDPTQTFADPRPDWFVRWYYAFLYLKPRGFESFAMVYLPILIVLGLLLLPLLRPYGERSLSKRPWAVVVAGVVVVGLGTLTWMGMRAPWAPAYDTRPLGAAELGDAPPGVLAGATVFYARGCQYCHVVLGEGGRYGPDLTEVAVRITPPELTVRIVQGHRQDMPAYVGILSDEDLARIVTFLQALPARRDQPGMR